MVLNEPDLWGKFPGVISSAPEFTSIIGERLSSSLYPGLSVLLCGDLGSGKTCLARSIGAALGVGRMKSPTFTIEAVHKVPGKDYFLVHCDLYRLCQPIPRESADDAVFLSIEERLAQGDVALIEWGEMWRTPPDSDRWDICISICPDGTRIFDMSARGVRALSALSAAYGGILSSAAANEGTH
ncbi:MAG: tRNA (adenosine(37)-N6)-threonylcarbamoyltransferase complex ATPase subunit type 1 TsaE [Synergistaceae bacterium]|jgi:tRNA threonylcarbamoyladenosine biosynthesis protein TsaE|nr:tRNA (adenosine(37)-N6)-threonylcarbamoyltransferase complex ATPase subunit type 1 TsaE [Synergistaceae bacterium]